ncbi:MAG: WD40/YVTN/BNR-like repeat-containing protein [Candidatus Binataceae bacterium]
MRLCVGTAKGIVILNPERAGPPLMVLAVPSSVWCLARDCADPNLLYAGSVHNAQMGSARGKGSLARSNDGGRAWQDITPGLMRDEDVWAVAAAPDVPGEVFIGTSHARIMHSLDGGRGFTECSAFLKMPGRERWTFPPAPHVPHVRAFAFDPNHSNVLYAAVEEGGIFRSRDRGMSFEPLSQGIHPDVHAVAVDPCDGRRLYATTGRGFYYSVNSGNSWQFVKGLNRSYAVPLIVRKDCMYIAAAAGPPPLWSLGALGADAVIFRSIDQGRGFTPLPGEAGGVHRTRGMVMRFFSMPGEDGEFFAALSDGSIISIDERNERVVTVAEKLPPIYDMVALT